MRNSCRLFALLVLIYCYWPTTRLFAAAPEKPLAKGSRQLCLAVTEAENKDYGDAMAQAKSAGMQCVSLKLDWDDVEKRPGVFESPFPKIANGYYPGQKIQVSLRLATIDTNQNRIPFDLRDKPFNDPAVIARFNRFLDYVFDQMPDVKFAELSIGNEVDGLLGIDAEKWKQYTEFFIATRKHARQKQEGLKVGVSIMFSGHTGEPAKFATTLNEQADMVMVSYYPLTSAFKVREPKVVSDHFDTICKMYPNRPISFVEAGYPSGSQCDSSEGMQKQFIEELFTAWDRHADQIQIVTFVWLNDISASLVEGYKKYYGIGNPAFLDYLSTLGLRAFKGAGSDKPAFTALRQQTSARGWQGTAYTK